MARRTSGPKKKLRRGLWSPEEDEKLMNHIAKYGHGCWSSVPKLAGLERCGKSCRLRWINYLRPDLKRGAFSQEEEDLIIHLHSMLGNKWSQIAAQLSGRTDNEVKNFWNSYIKKKLRQRGIDPATHKPLAESTTTTTSRTAVFSDAELILSSSSAAGQHHMPPPPVTAAAESYVYSRSLSADGGGASDGSLQSLSGYNQTGDFAAAGYLHDPPAAAILPSASSSSTLNSMAGLSPADEQCNNNSSGGGASQFPWLELGTSGGGGGGVDEYGAALDELKWSDYVFDGYGGGHQYQQGQCIYGDSKDAVQCQFVDDASGLGGSSWCLN
ncbi:unnamed protein product [Urochloa humidicola]